MPALASMPLIFAFAFFSTCSPTSSQISSMPFRNLISFLLQREQPAAKGTNLFSPQLVVDHRNVSGGCFSAVLIVSLFETHAGICPRPLLRAHCGERVSPIENRPTPSTLASWTASSTYQCRSQAFPAPRSPSRSAPKHPGTATSNVWP